MQNKPVSRASDQDLPARQHRRQMLLQVWLPLVGTLILVLALVTLAIIGTAQGSSQVNRWGNISAIFVILPVLVGGLLLLVLTGGLAYGVNRLLKKVPDWMHAAQAFMQQIAQVVHKAADAAAEPVIKANTTQSRVSAFWDRLLWRKPTSVRQ